MLAYFRFYILAINSLLDIWYANYLSTLRGKYLMQSNKSLFIWFFSVSHGRFHNGDNKYGRGNILRQGQKIDVVIISSGNSVFE